MDSKELTAQARRIAEGMRRVFPTTPVPVDHRRPDGDIDWEVEEDLQRVIGRPWTDVQLEDWTHMIRPSAIRNGTNSDFFKYYVPSILCGVLLSPEWADPLAISALLPDNPKFEPREEWRSFRNKFSPAQAGQIVTFLQWVKDVSDPTSADWYGADAGLNGLWN
ncbi:hypothetical protein [Ralstonia sp. 24A2]|uniref:hypothetical protein n=1 Tax=Ralstonia sp. 24A2 TaxID=3447364 RepID=UPI003F6A5183